MPSNPITPQEQYDILVNRSLTPRDGSTTETYMAAAYILMPPATVDGPVKWRLFDAAYVKTGIIDPNRLGSGATGAGNLYLADDGTWKTISVGGGGDMLKATYDVDNTGIVDNAEAISVLGRNSTGVTLYRGTIVYISGSTGNRPNFVKAQANVEATSAGTFGVVVSNINNNADGYVAHIGVLDNLDTRSTATNPFTDVTLADGDTVYLHPTIAGYITNVKPSAPNHLVYVGKVTRTSPTNGTIVYRIQNGYELDELHDVAIASKANNDLLVYESSTSLWKNKTFAAIFGGTPLVSVPTLAQVTTAGNTTTNNITVGTLYFGNGNHYLVTDNSTYAMLSSNRTLQLATSGNPVLSVFTTQNVAIGTTTDAGYKLDVNGLFRLGGAGGRIYSNSSNILSMEFGNTFFSFGPETMRLSANSGGFIELSSNYTARLRVAPTTGNILIGTTTDGTAKLTVAGSITAASALAQGVYFNNTLVAAANNDVLVGLDINPTFTNGAFTGVANLNIRASGWIQANGGFAIGSSAYSGGIPINALTISGATPAKYYVGSGAGFSHSFRTASNDASGERLRITDSNVMVLNTNMLVGTTTDSGYKLDVVGADSRFNGVRVGLGAGGVSSNTVVGTNALANNTTGLSNTAVGNGSLRYNIDGTYNTAYGVDSLNANIGGGQNVAMGWRALSASTTAYLNVAIGSQALFANITGQNNTALGSNALYNNTASDNTAVGYQAGYLNTSGTRNVGVGRQALYTTSTGNYNVGIGSYAMNFNSTGTSNIAVGDGALYTNSVGNNNVAIGDHALNLNTASNNTAVGYQAAYSNTSGASNVAFGYRALYTNTTGANNTALGYEALVVNTIGSLNVAVGLSALRNSIGDNNIGIGYAAGYSNTASNIVAIGHSALYANVVGINLTAVGYQALRDNTGSFNTAVGNFALVKNTTGTSNSAVGSGSLQNNTTGSGNSAFGESSLDKNTTGSNNIGIGVYAGGLNTTSSNNVSVGVLALYSTTGGNNTALGYQAGQAGVANTTGVNNIFIGYQATGVSATESNRTWIGNSSTTSTWLAGNVLVGTTTNAGYKLDIDGTFRATGIVYADSTINQPVSFGNKLIFMGSGNYSKIALADGTNWSLDYHSGITVGDVGYHRFYTGSTSGWVERLRIENNGNVGIGTSTPSYPLHISSAAAANIFGTVQSTSASGTAAWVAFNDQSDNVVYRVFGSGASGTQMGIALARTASLIANLGGSGSFLLGTYSATNFIMGTGNAEKMRIVDSTGNILIATTTDLGNKLEVSGTINATDYKVGNVPGWNGIINIPTMPPIMITVTNGIITNVM